MMIGVSDSSGLRLQDLHPARPCVYLDLWVWIRLARAANGEPREASDLRVLAAVQNACTGRELGYLGLAWAFMLPAGIR
jgi:hypothetical protein